MAVRRIYYCFPFDLSVYMWFLCSLTVVYAWDVRHVYVCEKYLQSRTSNARRKRLLQMLLYCLCQSASRARSTTFTTNEPKHSHSHHQFPWIIITFAQIANSASSQANWNWNKKKLNFVAFCSRVVARCSFRRLSTTSTLFPANLRVYLTPEINSSPRSRFAFRLIFQYCVCVCVWFKTRALGQWNRAKDILAIRTFGFWVREK